MAVDKSADKFEENCKEDKLADSSWTSLFKNSQVSAERKRGAVIELLVLLRLLSHILLF